MNLLTGATGLVGAHLLACLISNEEKTRAIYRTEHKKQRAIKVISNYGISLSKIEKHVDWYCCDILNIPKLETAFEDISHVYHCAGFISNSPSDYQMMRKVNIEGTANLVNLALHFSIQKFCHISSIAALGKGLDHEMITENTILAEDQKRSTYEISKFGAEMEVWRASQEGLNVVIVNPGIILGEGFYDSGSGLFLHKMRKGLRFYPPKTTGFISVYDVCKVTYELMKSDLVNERFILVSENLSFKTVVTQFSKLYQQPLPQRKLKPWMLYIAWFFELIKSLFGTYKRQLTLEIIPSLFEDSYYSSSKIKSEIHFEFEPLESYAPKIVERSKKLV